MASACEVRWANTAGFPYDWEPRRDAGNPSSFPLKVAFGTTIWPGKTGEVSFGVSFDVSRGFVGIVTPVWSATERHGLYSCCSRVVEPGDGRTVTMTFVNFSDEAVTLYQGDEVARVTFTGYAVPSFVRVDAC